MTNEPSFESALDAARDQSFAYPSAPESNETWRVEVDEIIDRIAPRPMEPRGQLQCTETLIIPEAPNTSATPASTPIDFASTDPGAPAATALRAAPVSHPQVGDEMVTSPAHPATVASLRSACLVDLDEAGGTAETRQPTPLPPSPYANAADSEARRTDEGVGPALAHEVARVAQTIHSTLGPGLREHVYAQCLAQELANRGYDVARDVAMSVRYDGMTIQDAFRVDLLVQGSVIVEVRAVERVLASHEAQLTTYLQQSGLRTGILFNFNEPELEAGIRWAQSE